MAGLPLWPKTMTQKRIVARGEPGGLDHREIVPHDPAKIGAVFGARFKAEPRGARLHYGPRVRTQYTSPSFVFTG